LAGYQIGVFKAVFDHPGDGIKGIMETLRKRSARVRFYPVRVHHEESAAFMVCGLGRHIREHWCLTTSGPCGIRLLNGSYYAKLGGNRYIAGLQSTPDSYPLNSRTSNSTSFSWMLRSINLLKGKLREVLGPPLGIARCGGFFRRKEQRAV
jgi:hypothetical protein